MNKNHRPNQEFADRLQKLWRSSGMTQQALADRLLIDRSYLNRLLSGKKTPSDRLMQQVTFLEQMGVDSDYKGVPALTAMAGNTNPTREQCEAYFATYLDKAESVPGGIGHTWVQLQLHFATGTLDKLQPPK